MLNLVARDVTGPDWAARAVPQIDEILLDHAHCEKKAAATAVGLLFRYPEQGALLVPLSQLAREELAHFEEVLRHLRRRGVAFCRLKPSGYAGLLVTAVRTSEPQRLLDTLLCCALIEARSCERMTLLAQALEAAGADPEFATLAALYRGLLQSEARHHSTYVELATAVFPGPRELVRERLRELAEHEAQVIAQAPLEPRLHSR